MGKSSSQTTGYRYGLSVVMVLQEGAVDEILEFRYSERTTWKYDPTAGPYVPDGRWGKPFVGVQAGDKINWNQRIIGDTDITIKGYQVLGGDDREGGMWGNVHISMGKSATPCPFLANRFGANTPAYVDCTTLIFENFIWSGNNPYFKPLAVLTKSFRQNWRDDNVWYPEKLVINDLDMNPAHILYQTITSRKFGMDYFPAEIDDANFRAAADRFYSEGMGLSIRWDQESSVEDFNSMICQTVGAELRLDESTGLYQIALIRDNYSVESLTEITPDQIIEMQSFERAGYGELGNQLTVMYTDRDQVQQPVTLQAQDAIAKQGGQIIPVTREYLAVRDPVLAARLCARDLAGISSTLAAATIIVDMTLYNHQRGDVIALTLPSKGMVKAPFRILDINKKQITDGKIEVVLAEDVFGLPDNSYVGVQPSEWTNPSGPPEAAAYQRMDEVNYRDIVRYLPAEQSASLQPNYCFARAAAVNKPGGYFGFKLLNSPLIADYYEEKARGDFCASGVLVNDMTYTSTNVQLSLISNVNLIVMRSYLLIDDEMMLIENYDPATQIAVVGRGVIDSVPKTHSAGARVWFPEVNNAVDPTQHLPATTSYYKIAPITGYGALPASSAATIAFTFNGRAQRPYPPGNLKVNGALYPDYIQGLINISWASRNRLTQADQLIPTTAASIAPEDNTAYNLTIKGETGIAFVALTLTDTQYNVDPASEYQPGVVEYGTNQIFSATGLQMLDSTLSINIAIGHGKVDSGWMHPTITSTQVSGRFVNGSTGAITTRTDNSLASQLTNTVFNVKTSLPLLDKYWEQYYTDNPTQAANAGFTPYNGWAAYKIGSQNINVAIDSIPEGTPMLDRRINSSQVFVRAVASGVLGYSARTVQQAKQFSSYQLSVYRMQKSAVVTGPLTITRTQVANYLFGSPNQFDSLEALPDTSTLSTIITYGDLLSPANLGIIFDELMYVPGLEGFNPVNSNGKPLDITNIVNAHVTINGSRRDATFIMKVNATGDLTYLATRLGIVLSDKVTATQGFEVVINTRSVALVNSSTGALSTALGTVGVTGDVPVAVYGDYANQQMYILVMRPNVSLILYKYDTSFTLLGQVSLPVTAAVLSRPAAAIVSSMIREGAGAFYVRCTSANFSITKDFSLIRNIQENGSQMSVPYPGYSDASSAIVKLNGKSKVTPGADRGLADENGDLGLNYYSLDRPRIQGQITIELESTRDSLTSTQKHTYSVKRNGYGLNYGVYYGD